MDRENIDNGLVGHRKIKHTVNCGVQAVGFYFTFLSLSLYFNFFFFKQTGKNAVHGFHNVDADSDDDRTSMTEKTTKK